MTAPHSSYEEIAALRRGSVDYRAGYDEARRAFVIGQAVHERRLALGMSQTELAAAAHMTQPALSRLEAGGAVPTIPVLARIAAALGAELSDGRAANRFEAGRSEAGRHGIARLQRDQRYRREEAVLIDLAR